MSPKRRRRILFVFAILFIVCFTAAACDTSHTTHNFGTVPKYDDEFHWYECKCGEKSNIELHTFGAWQVVAGGKRRADCTICDSFKTEPLQEERYADFYAINDFHGKWERMSTVGGHLVENRNANANTVLINSGDMFQGSMESNSNYGALLSDCMDDIGFDAFTFGNHEFDWGLDNLMTLAENSNVPFLGANIYHWNATSKTFGTFADELAQEYVVKTLDNGLKIGIIGVIGKDQITSISSQLVQTIGFKDPSEVIPNLSAKLRGQLGCDVVVVSAHTGPETFLNDRSWDITEYCDAVFCAHTHRPEVYERNGVPFIQGGSYGSYVSHVQLRVSSVGDVSSTVSVNEPYSSNWPNRFSVSKMIDNSNAKIADEANQVLATAVGSLSSSDEIPRIVCNAIADYATENYSDFPIALAMVNVARNNINSGAITYTELYEAIPFDNVVYIAKVSGMDIITEARYGNYIWRVSEKAIVPNNYYYIAVIDYMLFHQNSSRDYNYFRSAFTSGFDPIPIENDNYDAGMYNYRLITRDWLLAQQSSGNYINAADYSGYNANTNVDLLTYDVTFGGDGNGVQVEHSGTLDDPYTISDAAILASGITEAYNAFSGYLTAIVSDVSNPKYSNIDGSVRNVYVSDEQGNSLQLYWISKNSSSNLLNNWNQTNFELKEGDVVVIYGKFIMYNGIVEITDGYCVSVNGNAA